MECSICCEKFNKSNHLKIHCKTCEDGEEMSACRTCCQKYILEKNKEPSCMFCNFEWENEFLNEYFPKKFLNVELKNHRENILLDMQIARLPETQQFAANLKLVEQLEEQRKILDTKKLELQRELSKVKKATLEINLAILDIRQGKDVDKVKNTFIYKCPIEGCNGFLNEKYECGLCNRKICKHCMEEKLEDHECDEETKKSVSFLKKDTKPCPKCGQLIHKINGCDQMWCPGCKTPFSWRTGEIEQGHVHNPEYYRWMRETGQNIGRDPLDERFDPCGNQVPPYQFILNKCRSYFPQIQHYGRFVDNRQTIIISNMHRLILHLQFVNRNNQARVNATETYYRDLRAKYLLNRIDKSEFKKKIQMHDKSVKKETAYNNVWNLLSFVLIEYIGKIAETSRSVEEGRELINNLLLEAEKTREFCNKAFQKVGKKMNNVYPGLSDDWVQINNMGIYIKRKQALEEARTRSTEAQPQPQRALTVGEHAAELARPQRGEAARVARVAAAHQLWAEGR